MASTEYQRLLLNQADIILSWGCFVQATPRWTDDTVMFSQISYIIVSIPDVGTRPALHGARDDDGYAEVLAASL